MKEKQVSGIEGKRRTTEVKEKKNGQRKKWKGGEGRTRKEDEKKNGNRKK